MDGAATVKPLMMSENEIIRDSNTVTPIHLGPIADAIIEQIRERISIANIRTLFACIGVGESIPFNLPPKDQILTRLKSNGDYFLTNYLLVTTCVFFFLLFFFHPIQLIVCILVGCGWYVVLTKKHHQMEQYSIGGKHIGQDAILLGITAITIIFLVFFIMQTILFASSTSAMGCTLHAFFRNNRLKDDDSYSTSKIASKTETDEIV